MSTPPPPLAPPPPPPPAASPPKKKRRPWVIPVIVVVVLVLIGAEVPYGYYRDEGVRVQTVDFLGSGAAWCFNDFLGNDVRGPLGGHHAVEVQAHNDQ
jgi:hypothetical protein